MTVVKVKPAFKPFSVTEEFDKLMDQVFNDNKLISGHRNGTSYRKPLVNVIETADDFRLEIAAPGLEKKDFHVNIDKDILTISAAKEENADVKYIKQEFDYRNFERNFRLPDTIDQNNIKASFANGILSVTLAKKEEAKELPPRKINIV